MERSNSCSEVKDKKCMDVLDLNQGRCWYFEPGFHFPWVDEESITMPIISQVTFRGMAPSPVVEADIRKRIEALEQFHSRPTSCHVRVEAPHRHKHKGKLYSVRIDLRLPYGEVVVANDGPLDHAHEDAHVAVRDAFNALTRRLEDAVRRMRGDIKQHGTAVVGQVTDIFRDDGYGFIEGRDGRNVYFCAENVANGQFAKLAVGSRVEEIVTEGDKGPQASTVRLHDHN
jgi:cold shock CspA family protein